ALPPQAHSRYRGGQFGGNVLILHPVGGQKNDLRAQDEFCWRRPSASHLPQQRTIRFRNLYSRCDPHTALKHTARNTASYFCNTTLAARLADHEVLPRRRGLEQCVEFFQRGHCLSSFIASVCIA